MSPVSDINFDKYVDSILGKEKADEIRTEAYKRAIDRIIEDYELGKDK